MPRPRSRRRATRSTSSRSRATATRSTAGTRKARRSRSTTTRRRSSRSRARSRSKSVPQTRVREGVPDGRILVWGAAVRFLHWTLAALVVFDFVVDDGGPVHRAVGYVAAGVVVLRLLRAAFAGGEEGLRALKPSVARTVVYLRQG